MPWIQLSAHTQHSFSESETKHFHFNLWNHILGKVLDKFVQRGDDNIDHVKHIVKFNLQIRYPALFRFIQIIVWFFNTFDQGTIAIVHKQLQRPFAPNNILIIEKIIIGIPLKWYLLLKVYLVPLLKQVHACCIKINPEIFYLEGILINKIWYNKRCHCIIS